MKKTIVKRLVYHSPASGEVFYGGMEYDGNLTAENILGSIHEIGKTQWVNGNLWVVRDGQLIYRITVEDFIQYTKTRFELFMDAVRRI